MDSQTEARKARIIEIFTAFPEAIVEDWGIPHLAFKVRNKTFAYYQNNHHGDNMISLVCKAAPGELDFLLGLGEERFFKPSYLGVHGWIGVRVDLPEIDWDEIADFAGKAYRLSAPKRLVASM